MKSSHRMSLFLCPSQPLKLFSAFFFTFLQILASPESAN
jgi:hypothetical protein